MGNSEVGHMNIGSGRIIYTDIENINREFENENVENLPVFQQFLDNKKNNRIHLFIMLSDGGVHSHINHLFFFLDVLEKKLSHQTIYIHAFLDGRDTPPNSARQYISVLQQRIKNKCLQNVVFLSTIIGRFYAMDRNKNWDRTQRAYELLANGVGNQEKIKFKNNSEDEGESEGETIENYIQKCYSKGIYDEFMEPVCIRKEGHLKDDDTVFFLNFRADRARQITQSICDASFSNFHIAKKPKLAQFISFTEYDKNFPIPFLFSNQTYPHTLGETDFSARKKTSTHCRNRKICSCNVLF